MSKPITRRFALLGLGLLSLADSRYIWLQQIRQTQDPLDGPMVAEIK
ncbi:MAG: hypothetical protein ABIS50_16215 [Luteolibacter sp.]